MNNLLGTTSLLNILSPYQILIEEKIKAIIPDLGGKTALRDATMYALLNGGKRFRPSLTLMIAKSLGNDVDVSNAALTVEMFHTASLVVDDLPSMDDDDERRGKPSVHKLYGEGIALLVSYALIAEGYRYIAKAADELKPLEVLYNFDSDRVCKLALENAAFNTGLMGATGGQFLDISPPDYSLPTLRDMIHKKTVSLFEIAFVFGWLFGRGDIDKLDLVKRAASHFGMAFQMADDLDDVEQDRKIGRLGNLAVSFGEEAVKKMFHVEHAQYLLTLKQLGLHNSEIAALINLKV